MPADKKGTTVVKERKGTTVVKERLFQNETTQTGFQQQSPYFRIRKVKPVFIGERCLFGIVSVKFQAAKCITNMLSDTFLSNTVLYFDSSCCV